MGRNNRLKELDHLRQDIARMGHLVVRQLETALQALDDFDPTLAESVIENDDLIDNLNLRVEARSFEMASRPGLSDGQQRAARSALKVATNLEHAGDAAADICKHIRIMKHEGVPSARFDFAPLPDLAVKSLREAVRAYLREDLALAKRACQREPEMDHLYVEGLTRVSTTIESRPGRAREALHELAFLKYLEKIGDYVLNIGEQAIYLTSGRRLKFGQFQQLDEMLGAASSESGFAAYTDGISGAVVARVGNGVPLLYKEGSKRKIEAEVAKSAAWRNIDRNLIPKVLTTTSYQGRQALLREYVDGALLSYLLFEEGDTELELAVTKLLCQTLRHLWTHTLVARAPEVGYVQQIEERLPEVYSVHPELRRQAATRPRFRGGVCLPLRQQLERLSAFEPELAPPFSVWLHGDFNPNNVVYSRRDGALKFIDIHRSHFGDYLEDVTVFLVGLKREPELSNGRRAALKNVESVIVEAVRGFAAQHSDDGFERRMLLGLGRSYLTSARIILQPAHAESLFRQGRVCLQKALDRA
jgi:phosphate transport system regulatory protein PhoU